MSSSVGNIRIEPVDVYWQIEEQWQVGTVADVAGSLQSKWFKLGKGGQEIYSHYVWLNLGGAGVDPAPSGLTAIPVTGALNITASALALAIATAVDLSSDFVASSDGSIVLITNQDIGDSSGMLDGTAGTGFSFTQCQEGGDLYAGLCDGDIEASFEQSLYEVTAHQTGTTLLADLRQGTSAEVSLTLKESDLDKFKQVLVPSSGGKYTPSGGTELFGWGNSRQGSNTVTQARRLRLHPVSLSDADHTRDLCFWKAFPLPESLVFSGENPQVMSLTFKTYLDDTKPTAIRHFVYGDWEQLVPVVP